MPSFLDRFADCRLILVTGKGGIGKTISAALIARHFSQLGESVLLVENTAVSQIPPLFGKQSAGHKEVNLASNLSTINLDAPTCFREYMVKYLGKEKIFEKITDNRLVQSFLNAIPGLGESLLLGRFFYTLELRPDLRCRKLILDGPALGHFLQLMSTPEIISRTGIGGHFAREIERVLEFLKKPDNGVMMVCTPDELSIRETLEFLPKLRSESPVAVKGIIVNRSLHFAPQENEADSVGFGALAESFLQRRRQLEIDANQRLLAYFGGLPAAQQLPISYIPELGVINDGELPQLSDRLLSLLNREGSV